MKVSDREFARIVARALDNIPEEIMRHVENVAVTIEDRHSPEVLEEMGLEPDEPLFGLYTGVALTEREISSPELMPDTIVIFKEPLLEYCTSREELEEEIEITVVHEIAHYFGISEERLAELGYD
ncbi:MAG TPA: metallopeptidase family protein [Deltaproteobacteria bacterium]|nr:metallopeptidase family protein [Deltaproteobacteria bacterium]HOM29416.1 metallopeptidase family protein [Deltaproteobacteria bacterium]HPP80252.1 metallopeptidase family protein [Deltaproteobacteria bacterium]